MITPNLTKKKTSTKCHFKPNCIIQASRLLTYGTTNSKPIAQAAPAPTGAPRRTQYFLMHNQPTANFPQQAVPAFF